VQCVNKGRDEIVTNGRVVRFDETRYITMINIIYILLYYIAL